MRIVLDTNVVLSALLWRGTPYQLLDAIRSRGEVRLFTSPALLDELADYVEAVEVVEPEHVPRVVPDDADDDYVTLATAAIHDRRLKSLG